MRSYSQSLRHLHSALELQKRRSKALRDKEALAVAGGAGVKSESELLEDPRRPKNAVVVRHQKTLSNEAINVVGAAEDAEQKLVTHQAVTLDEVLFGFLIKFLVNFSQLFVKSDDFFCGIG